MTVVTVSSAMVLLWKNIDEKVHYQSAYLKNRASAVYNRVFGFLFLVFCKKYKKIYQLNW